jgi:hypothetical protein
VKRRRRRAAGLAWDSLGSLSISEEGLQLYEKEEDGTDSTKPVPGAGFRDR